MYLYVCLVRGMEYGHPIVATAPSSACIKVGDKVVLEGEGDKVREAYTEGVYMDDTSEEFGLLLKIAEMEKPARIYGKYRFNEFKWEDKEDE